MANDELSGEHGAKLDDMGRISLPRQWCDVVEKHALVMLRGGKPKLPCLCLYTIEDWKAEKVLAVQSVMLSKLERLNQMIPVKMDKQGRILIPPTLRKYGKLSKDCILVGQDDHIVMWDEDRYDEYLEAESENFEAEERALKVLKLKMGEGVLGDGGDCAHSGAAGADSGMAGPKRGD